MSVKTSKAKELLERFSTSLKSSISENYDLDKERERSEQRKISKNTRESARNTAMLMNVLRLM